MEIGDFSVQVEKALCSFHLPEAQLATFLTSCGAVRLSWAERQPYGACLLLNRLLHRAALITSR